MEFLDEVRMILLEELVASLYREIKQLKEDVRQLAYVPEPIMVKKEREDVEM
jgi:hypothetical protein